MHWSIRYDIKTNKYMLVYESRKYGVYVKYIKLPEKEKKIPKFLKNLFSSKNFQGQLIIF